jgi:response regulator RpfG family c-di-GMP phosphodiesterase/DNA-binding SARP family transcriptional activator
VHDSIFAMGDPSQRTPPAAGAVVQLFGAPRLQFGAGAEHPLDRKTAAMLALAHFEPGISRATAARWLWPESDASGARANLRVLLFRVARLAGGALVTPGNFLHLEAGVAVADDVVQLRAIEASNGARLPLPKLLDAIDVDDLPAFHEWLERTRARIVERIRTALRERALTLEEAGQLDPAAALAEWLVDLDPSEEVGYRDLMRLQLARGERSAALAAYERCRSWMSQELGVDPSAATQALHAQALSPTRPAASAAGGADEPDLSALELCRRLERLMGEGGERFVLERLVRSALLLLPDPGLADDDQAYCCGIIARYHFRAGHAEDAAAWSDLALAAARRASPERRAWALGQRVNLALEVLDLRLACALLAEAETTTRDRPALLSRVWHQIGAVLLTAGRLDAAETAIRRSITMLEDYDGERDDEMIARLPAMRINLANCLLDQGRNALAENVLDETLIELDRHRGFRARELRVVALLDLVCIYRLDGRTGQARTALALARTGIHPLTMARYRYFAELYERLVEDTGKGAGAAEATLAWVAGIDCGDANRIAMLRTLVAAFRHEALRDAAARALDMEQRLRLRGCRALLRSQSRRWLREFGRDAPAPAPPTAAGATPGELEAFERMCEVAELREGRDGHHGARVGQLARRLAQYIGAPASLVDSLEAAARLHDLGKAALSDQALRADRDDPDDEASRMYLQHTTFGAALLAGQTSPVARLAELIALQHHERWDGHGAPHGLAGPAIGLAARLVAVADAFESAAQAAADIADDDADRLDMALAHIETGSGSAFDPKLALAFVLMMRSDSSSSGTEATESAPGLLGALSAFA